MKTLLLVCFIVIAAHATAHIADTDHVTVSDTRIYHHDSDLSIDTQRTEFLFYGVHEFEPDGTNTAFAFTDSERRMEGTLYFYRDALTPVDEIRFLLTRFPETMSNFNLIQAVEIPHDDLPVTIAVGFFRYDGVFHKTERELVGLLMILRYCDRYKIKFRTTMPVENASVLDGLIDRQLELIVANFREEGGRPE